MAQYGIKLGPILGQIRANIGPKRTLEVESHKCACLFIHGPILGQIRSNMGQKSTLKVKSHIFELISIHIILSAMFGATLVKIAGKVSIGPILDQIRSNIGPNQGQHWTKKAHVWVKSYKYEWMFIHIG